MAKKKVKKKTKKRVTKRAERPVKRKRVKRKIAGTVHVREKSPAARQPINRQGRETLLNDEMLAKMILLWRHGIPNDKIARILGIGITALKTWVRENRPVTVTIVDAPDSKVPRKVTVGLKDLMEHERENLKADYITRLETIIESATKNGDLKTASHNLRWMMEKLIPHVFGDPKLRSGDWDPDKPKRVGFPLKPPDMN